MSVRRVGGKILELYFRLHIYINILRAKRKYEKVASPFKYIHIDPYELEYYETSFDYIKDTGKVQGGDWDIQAKENTISSDYNMYGKYDAYHKHFNEDVPWSQTDYYPKRLNQIKQGDSGNKNSKEDLDEYLKKVDEIYEHIKNNGFKTQIELLEDGDPVVSNTDAATPVLKMLLDDVPVSIGRDGTIYKQDASTGRHRIIIARSMNLDKIPARVVARHKQWQKERDRFPGEVTSDHHRQHPDLRDLDAGK